MTKNLKRDVMDHLYDALMNNSDIEGQAEHLINALGLTVAPAKPEPGTIWMHRTFGTPAFGTPNGLLAVIQKAGFTVTTDPGEDISDYVPARVVPAEPVELSESEGGAIYEEVSTSYHYWEDMPISSSGMQPKDIVLTVNAALDPHGRAEVS